MDVTRSLKLLVAVMLLFASSGASCRHWVRQYTEPRTLAETATLEQIAEKVNSNSAKVISAQSTQAKLKAEGFPALDANIALMPQRRFRMQASKFGPRVDLGSNDEQFWVWIKDNEPHGVFVCRHDQFATSGARQVMPIEPERLVEFIGLPHIDTNMIMGPPQVVGANRIEIYSRLPSELGDLKKKTIVDGWNGQVIEQHIYDSLGMLIASSFTSNYKHDPTTGAAMPRSIEIQWPTTKAAFKLEVSDWIINQIPPDDMAIWTMPQPADYPIIDLADPNLHCKSQCAAIGAAPRCPDSVMPQQPVTVRGVPLGESPPLPPAGVHPAASHPPGPINPLR